MAEVSGCLVVDEGSCGVAGVETEALYLYQCLFCTHTGIYFAASRKTRKDLSPVTMAALEFACSARS